MDANVMHTQTVPVVSTSEFSWLQRYVLRRFHPRHIFIDAVGFIWFTYFFWNHDWISAIGVIIFSRIVAFVSVMNIDTELFAQSILGKIGLLHLNPFNMAIQLVGTVVLLFGLWDHSSQVILAGISLILIGHVFGWSKVNSTFKDVPM